MADSRITLDRPAPGLVVAQPRRGFRYGAEAFWVAGFVLCELEVDTVVDLGTGSGIIAALLARQGLVVSGVELREEWQPLWALTREHSAPMPSLLLTLGTVSDCRGAVDCVVSNPPFFSAGTGPVAADPWRRAARTETVATLGDFVEAAFRVLHPSGKAVLVLPVERAGEVQDLTRQWGGHVRRVLRVGRRRALFVLGPGEGALVESAMLADSDPRVQGWVTVARGAIDHSQHLD